MAKTCAFVFARGGSKGLKRKNILPIGGLPMLVHSIQMASSISSVDRIYVSTDCQEIAQVASESDAEVIHRPPELASDTAAEWLAWQHAIQTVQLRHGNFDTFLSLPCTAPLRRIVDVENCLMALREDVDAVLTITPAQRSPWFNMVVKTESNFVRLISPSSSTYRRQDSPECFDITTVAYAAKASFILSSQSIWEGKVAAVEVPREYSIDIDTPLDYAIAQFIMEQWLPYGSVLGEKP